MASVVIRGFINFKGEPERIGGAILVIQLQETGRADAPANIVSEKVIKLAEDMTTSSPVKFQISVKKLIPSGVYSIWAFVDVDGNDEPNVGDYITTEYFPWSNSMIGKSMIINLNKIR